MKIEKKLNFEYGFFINSKEQDDVV